MAHPLTVFICSTFTDLSAERERVLDAVRRLQLQHDSMEFFGARSDLPIETCLAEVRRSDMLVVVVGHRYGSLVPDIGISFSEAEYREGYRLGKPCLVYLRDENVPVLPRHVERDPEKLGLLERWKKRLTSRHTVATFSDAQHLAVQVAADLSRTIQALEGAQHAAAPSGATDVEVLADDFREILNDALEKGVSQREVLSALRQTISELLGPDGHREPTVFLSYSQADKQTVRRVAKGLRADGIKIWFDEGELKLGDSIRGKIETGLDSADFVAFFLSKASMQSEWAQHELNAAISKQVSEDRGAVVLPVLLDDVEIPALLRDVMYLDMRDGDVGRGIRRLADSIKHHSYQVDSREEARKLMARAVSQPSDHHGLWEPRE